MKTKLIFSPQLAQFLLHNGLTIIELKRKRGSTETVYVFKYDDKLNDLIQQWRNNK